MSEQTIEQAIKYLVESGTAETIAQQYFTYKYTELVVTVVLILAITFGIGYFMYRTLID